MDLVLLAARLLLAAVFGVAGLTKLADVSSSRQALVDFGLSARVAGPAARLLPLAELVVAVTLVLAESARWGAAGAFVLLALFSAAIGLNLARGRRPACRCFGQLHAAPIGWLTLSRNAVLAIGAAGVALVQPPETNLPGGPSPSGLSIPALAPALGVGVGVILLAVVGAQAWFIVQLLRQHGRILLRLDALEAELGVRTSPAGLKVGTFAPEFSLPDLEAHEPVSLKGLRAMGKPVLLAFVDPDCGSCEALLPELAAWQHTYVDRLTIGVISLGDLTVNRSTAASLGLTRVLLQRGHEVADQYHVVGTPSAVLIEATGTLASPLAEGVEAIRKLVGHRLPPSALNGKAGVGQPESTPLDVLESARRY